MKRLMSTLLIFTLLLTGCSKGKPKNMPQDVYDQGVRLANVIDNYYGGTATLDDIDEMSDEVFDALQIGYDNRTSDEKFQIIKITGILTDIGLAMTDMYLSIATQDGKDEGSKKLRQAQKDLKKALGM